MDKNINIKLNKQVAEHFYAIDAKLEKEHGSALEFYCLLLAKKDNPWHIQGLLIPEQEVSGASVNVEKANGRGSYEEEFVKRIENDEELLVVGTIHSHNNMSAFFSGTDDEDLENHAAMNFNEGLPFIDIVWGKQEFKTRVALKLGTNSAKQIFVKEDCDTSILSDAEIMQELYDAIEPLLTKHKCYLDEEAFIKSIRYTIDVEEDMKKIKKKTYAKYSSTTWGFHAGKQTTLDGSTTEESSSMPCPLGMKRFKKGKGFSVTLDSKETDLEETITEFLKEEDAKVHVSTKGQRTQIVVNTRGKDQTDVLMYSLKVMLDEYNGLDEDEWYDKEYGHVLRSYFAR